MLVGSVMRVRYVALAASLLFLGCKPTVGSSCEKREARCQDKSTQLICQEGKLIATPCRGPKGCQVTPTGVACDITANQPGDVCSTDEEGAGMCTDPKHIMTCTGGKYQVADCRGPTGCSTSDGRPHCDTTIAAVDDSCKENAKACALDGKKVLTCQGGKMALAFHCLGEGGCKSSGGKIDCDLTVARDGDPCIKDMEGKVACNIDEKSIVACKGGKFVVDEKCDKGKQCLSEGGGIRCAKPEAD